MVVINGRDISTMTHDQVVNFIRASREPHSGHLVLAVRQVPVLSTIGCGFLALMGRTVQQMPGILLDDLVLRKPTLFGSSVSQLAVLFYQHEWNYEIFPSFARASVEIIPLCIVQRESRATPNI